MADEHVKIRGVTSLAYWLDQQLRGRLALPYRGLLSIGLMAGISGSVTSLTKVFSTANILIVIATVVFQVALLINQLAQIYEYRQERAHRRRAKSSPAPGK